MKRFIFIIIIILLANCSGFTPYRVEGIPEECNFMYSTMSLVSQGKEFSLVDDTIESCEKAIKAMRVQKRNDCLYLIYGTNVIEKNNLTKYNNFNKCLSGIEIRHQ